MYVSFLSQIGGLLEIVVLLIRLIIKHLDNKVSNTKETLKHG